MNILSLFDGMSCGRVALERVGIKINKYYSSEIDKYAIKVSQKNYPDIIRLGDIFWWRSWDLSKIDLLIAGSPCQGFSFAGKQLNFKDPRSKLFFDFVDVLKTYKPKYFLLENVRMKKEYQDIISGILGVEPILINSRLVTYNQRKRLYWSNIPNIEQPEDRKLDKSDIVRDNKYGTIKVLKDRTRIVVEADDMHCLTARYADLNGAGRPMIIIDKDAIGEAYDSKQVGRKYRMLTPIECERLQTLDDNYTDGVSNSQRYKMLGNGWTVDVISHIFKNIK